MGMGEISIASLSATDRPDLSGDWSDMFEANECSRSDERKSSISSPIRSAGIRRPDEEEDGGAR